MSRTSMDCDHDVRSLHARHDVTDGSGGTLAFCYGVRPPLSSAGDRTLRGLLLLLMILWLFHPGVSMATESRTQWRPMSVRSYLGADRPEEFFLRPHLERGKFSTERPIEVSPEVNERIQVQDQAGQLVFTQTVADAR